MKLRIFDLSLNLIAEVQPETLEWGRSFYSASKFTITINFYTQYASELKENRLVMLGNDTNKVGIIEYIEFEETNKTMLKISGTELKGIFSYRITIPETGKSHQSFLNEKAETIMKDIVQLQCIDTSGMEIDNLEIATDRARGTSLTLSSRYKSVLLELEKIGRLSQLGFKLTPDLNTKKFIFEVLETDDKSSEVFFSDKFGNLEKTKYTKNNMNSYNYAIVGGTGTAEARIIQETGAAETGINKKVFFVDARDLTDANELIARGKQKITQYEPTESFECIIANKIFKYETDWDLGDIVTVQNSKIGILKTFLIEEIKEYYSYGKDLKLSVLFGKEQQSFKKYVDNETDTGID